MITRATVWVAGSWGTALAATLASKGIEVILWTRHASQAQEINAEHTNTRYFPQVRLPRNVRATTDVERAAHHGQALVYVAPSQGMRDVAVLTQPYVHQGHHIVHATKGFDPTMHVRMSEVIAQALPQCDPQKIVVLSGPSHAEEVIAQLPTTVVVASSAQTSAQCIQQMFHTPYLRVYTNRDVIGVEVAGALKNIIALGAGMSDGLGFGDNAKAALLTRGLAEITRLGNAMGAQATTFAGLAGMGDLVVTCTSRHSRNWRAGYACAQGKSLPHVLQEMGMVVEGVSTTKVALVLAQRYNVELPIATQLAAVLFEEKSPREAVQALMNRATTFEQGGITRS